MAFAAMLFALLPVAAPAGATTVPTDPGCAFTSPAYGTPACLPPPLLSLNGLYAATPTQAVALQDLETTAVTNTLTDHGLPPSDSAAVLSWGRYDAQGELFALIEQAVSTAPASRSSDQQQAVDWIAAVEQRQAELAAEDAGLEYAKWAGLDTNAYQVLVDQGADQSTLQTFLCGGNCADWQTSVENYNNANPSLATGGYCVYRSPAPYGTEYTGYNDPTCFAPCSSVLGCTPPTPAYDQFVKWGQADATDSMVDQGEYVQASGRIAAGLIFGGAVVGTGVGTAVLTSGLADALVNTALQTAILPYADAVEEGVATEVGAEYAAGSLAASAGVIAGVAIAAIATAVLEGITIANAADLPSQLAALLVGARTAVPDPATLLQGTNGAASLYSLFVGATLPAPLTQTCDNAYQQTFGPAGVYDTPTINGFPSFQQLGSLCLNPPAIPPATNSDARFLVAAKGAATGTSTSSITWTDAAAQATMTARLSGHWFIEQPSGSGAAVQSLSIAYTDWSGNQEVAWLLGNPTTGYQFVGYNDTAGAGTALNPSTCVADGTCWTRSSIDYVGSDGQDYSASVQGPPAPPTGTPTYSSTVQGTQATSTAFEASPVTFNANGYAPGNATAPISYSWQFQQAGATSGCLVGVGFPGGTVGFAGPCEQIDPTTLTVVPVYSAPVTGATASYTWPTTGQYSVQLTATDAAGNQAVTTFSVDVTDVPPAVSLTGCPSASPCTSTQAVSPGSTVTIGGIITHAGTLDSERVVVYWGDGSGGSAVADPSGIHNPTPSIDPLSLTAPDNTSLTFSDSHTYAAGGTYHATVVVDDQTLGYASATATYTVDNPAPALRTVDPASTAVGSAPTLTVGGAGFVPGSTVQWDGSPLTTSYVSPTELTAQVPAGDTAGTTAATVTVTNATPGGGTTSPQVVYVIPAQVTVTATGVATSTNPSGNATAQIPGGYPTVFGLAATANGAGTVALARYSTDPVTTAPPDPVNAYFDVFVPTGSTFTSVKVSDCNLAGGSVVDYYDTTTDQWVPVSGQAYNATDGCVTFTLTPTTTPSLTQLSGTIFGVENVPPVVSVPGPQSVPYGSPVSIQVSAADVQTTDRLTLRADGLPTGLTFTDNGDGTGTVSGQVTADVGRYTATFTADDGYSDSAPATVVFTVTPAPLTISADDQTTPYGAVPAYSWTGTGWVNGDSSSTLSAAPDRPPTCSANVDGAAVSATTPPGVYPDAIHCGGAVDPDYAISYTNGQLTVDPVLSLDESGLPGDVAHQATLDGRSVGLPDANVEVAYGTSHSFSYPAVVLDTSSGSVYFTNDHGFSGAVTANVDDTAVYETMAQIVSAALSGGGIDNQGQGNALTHQFDAVQADIAVGNDPHALTDLETFAAHVRAQAGKHLTTTTAQVLLADAQLVYDQLGGTGQV